MIIAKKILRIQGRYPSKRGPPFDGLFLLIVIVTLVRGCVLKLNLFDTCISIQPAFGLAVMPSLLNVHKCTRVLF